jgi:hypothetical protein
VTLAFEEPADGSGVRIDDPVQRRRYSLSTPTLVDPEPAPTDVFTFPVDRAVAVRTRSIRLPSVVATYVRTTDGEMVAGADHHSDVALSPGAYSVELCTPIKLYLRVESEVRIAADAAEMELSFGGETRVTIGARSHHDRPEATVTTTAAPEDVMAAVSTLGSALKTTSPERSFPTLRGHPPTLELGDDLAVPEELDRPETGVRIELPRERRFAYVAAPLAYYLGAAVVPGERPRLVTDRGFDYPLDGHPGFERAVERVLKRTFLLDCLVRTEGLYPVDLHERRALESDLALDFAALYDRSLAERLASYLAVPHGVVEDAVPEWKLTTRVAPTPEHVEVLPFVVDDLAVVKTADATPATAPSAVGETAEAVEDFYRSSRSTASRPGSGPDLVDPAGVDSLEQAWVGEKAPLGASKATVEAFRNKLDRGKVGSEIEIVVVCNDPKMADEHDAVGEAYGTDGDLPFEVDLRQGLTVRQLRAVLTSDVDFLHYVGHIDERGFECADGRLDAEDLAPVGVDAFLLNACSSYDQGMALIEGGGIGDVVTIADVIDSEAVEFGRTMARLLNQGFPLRAALDVAGDRSLIGSQYLVVGDGNCSIAQPDGNVATVLEIETHGDGFTITNVTYPTENVGLGSITGELDTHDVDEESLQRILREEDLPVIFDGEFYWNEEILALLD